jgi:serine/threonine protein kinase/tetratricopeptide (TPR) repeat protein
MRIACAAWVPLERHPALDGERHVPTCLLGPDGNLASNRHRRYLHPHDAPRLSRRGRPRSHSVTVSETLGQALAGRYEVVRLLGEGGMAAVYLARDLKHRRSVALKVLRPELTAALGPERFLREIEITAGLQHPHILPLLDSGEAAGFLYYVMPYVEGETLRQRLERQAQLPVDEAVRIAREVAEALDHAHQHGVIHRDIKPENVLMSGGHAIVADFGIARAVGSAAGHKLTRTGMAVGTSAYMSPEQISGDAALDGRCDVYSLACVLYELLAGQPPFVGATAKNVAFQHLSLEPRPVSALRPAVSAALATVIGQGLAKSPEARPTSAAEFAAALSAAGAMSGPSGTDVSRASRPAGGVVRWAMGLAAVSVAALVVWNVWPRPPGADASSSTIAVMPFAVRGSQLAYLRDGMADLLSTKLDGAGNLATVDPRAVYRAVAGYQDDLDPERAATAAERLGARWYVLGSVVAAGPSLQVSASLFDRTAGVTAVQRGEVQGAADSVFSLVDQVATKLLAGMAGGPDAEVQRVAAITTSSLPAFKAYMDGETAYRGGQYAAALRAFEQAVALDSTFALAYYRISTAAEWAWDEKQVYAGADRAVALADRLPERERQLVQVLGVRRRETNQEAESVLRSYVGTYPTDAEAWANLGELVVHTWPMHGRSMLEARPIWSRVASIDSAHSGALQHLARMDAYEGHLDSMDARLRHFRELNPKADRSVEMENLAIAAHADPDSMKAALDRLATASDIDRAVGVWNAAVYARNLDFAVAICHLMAAPGRSVELRRAGFQWLAGLEYARGHWSLAKQAVADLAIADPLAAAEFRAVFLALPFAPVSPEELKAAADELAALPIPKPTGGPQLILNSHDGLHPMLRAYGLGMFAFLRGDSAEAHREAEALRTMSLRADHEQVARDLGLGLEARLELAADRSESAVTTLEQLRLSAWHGQSLFSPFYARTAERFLRGEALVRAGRGEEALGWYTHIAENSPMEVAYVPVSLLRRAEIRAAQGDTTRAVGLYQQFLGMWKDADPELQPAVQEARRQLDELQGAAP